MVIDQKKIESPDVVYIKQATKNGYIPCKVGGVADLNYPDSKTRRGRVIDDGNICPTLTCENVPSVIEDWVWEIDGDTYLIRVRKITPKEAWRFMGFKDEDFNKASKVCSNSQLYKQAGNSICVPVLESVFSQLIDRNQTDEELPWTTVEEERKKNVQETD